MKIEVLPKRKGLVTNGLPALFLAGIEGWLIKFHVLVMI